MRKTQWSELTTAEFAALDPEQTIAILPIAAIEQHGPHLAVSTDTVIAEGMLREVLARLPDDLSVLVLPLQAIGKSNEHLRSPSRCRPRRRCGPGSRSARACIAPACASW
jgi:creatinine amidohydrolase